MRRLPVKERSKVPPINYIGVEESTVYGYKIDKVDALEMCTDGGSDANFYQQSIQEAVSASNFKCFVSKRIPLCRLMHMCARSM